MKYASKVVEQAKAWLGRKEADGSHKLIIDTYNAHKPLARGYAVQYDDAWCATFVSAVAIKLGYTDIIPTECSCSKMIALLKKLSSWEESDSRKPNPGDLIFYDWQDTNPAAENVNDPDHVGIVEKVSGNTITVIEGNYSKSVKRRTLAVNGKYIRGYGVPKYDAEASTEAEKEPATKPVVNFSLGMRNLKYGCKGEDVRALQILLKGRGYNGSMNTPDGIFGSRTKGAVKAYQKVKGLEEDGIAGKKTLSSLWGV